MAFRPFGFSSLATAFLLGVLTLLSGCGGGRGDSLGGSSSTSALTVSPSSTTGAVGQTLNFIIAGGLPGYNVASSAPSKTTVSAINLSGGLYSFTATLVSAGSVTLTVVDSNNTLVTVALTVTGSSNAALYTTAPGSITIASGGKVQYTIGGGTPPYSATSSNNSIVDTPSINNGTSLNFTGGASGSAIVTVTDSVGATTAINVTVANSAGAPLTTAAPGAITIGIGTQYEQSYAISGGTPGYSVTSANTNVATATLSPNNTTVTIVGVAAGVTTVNVSDATHATTVAINVNVATVSGTGFSTAPDTNTWTMGGACPADIPPYSVFFINGGVPPYTVTSSAPQIGTVMLAAPTGPVTASIAPVLISPVPPAISGGYFVVAWPNFPSCFGTGKANFNVMDSTGAVVSTLSTFQIN